MVNLKLNWFVEPRNGFKTAKYRSLCGIEYFGVVPPYITLHQIKRMEDEYREQHEHHTSTY